MLTDEITLVCDGSSLNNGAENSPAAAAALLEWRGKRKILAEYIGHGTNQQAEIIAACIGLETLKRPCRVKVISDSQYVVKTMLGEFRRKANHAFWERLDRATGTHKIEWTWTRGHAGHPLQEACDKAARRTAEIGKPDDAYFEKLLTSLD